MTTNEKIKLLRQKQQSNLREMQQALKDKAFIVPIGHPMQPQIKDRTIKPFRKPLYAKSSY